MKSDSLNNRIINTSMERKQDVQSSSNSVFWQWVALLEGALIILLLVQRLATSIKNKRKGINSSASEDIDFNSLHESFYHAKPLYNKLIRVCHPDRFPKALDPDRYLIAQYFAGEISKYRGDYRKLKELQQEIEDKLSITIK